MSIKQISVFVENKPGALYGLTGVLAQNGVDLRALSLAETSEFGIVRSVHLRINDTEIQIQDICDLTGDVFETIEISC